MLLMCYSGSISTDYHSLILSCKYDIPKSIDFLLPHLFISTFKVITCFKSAPNKPRDLLSSLEHHEHVLELSLFVSLWLSLIDWDWESFFDPCVHSEMACEHDRVVRIFSVSCERGWICNPSHVLCVGEIQITLVNDRAIGCLSYDWCAPSLELIYRVQKDKLRDGDPICVHGLHYSLDLLISLRLGITPYPIGGIEEIDNRWWNHIFEWINRLNNLLSEMRSGFLESIFWILVQLDGEVGKLVICRSDA